MKNLDTILQEKFIINKNTKAANYLIDINEGDKLYLLKFDLDGDYVEELDCICEQKTSLNKIVIVYKGKKGSSLGSEFIYGVNYDKQSYIAVSEYCCRLKIISKSKHYLDIIKSDIEKINNDLLKTVMDLDELGASQIKVDSTCYNYFKENYKL